MSDAVAKPSIVSRLYGRAVSLFFGKVTDENADAVIRDLSNLWYAFAVIQAALIGLLLALGETQAGALLDPAMCALGAYYVRSRKSRALAISLFLYSLGLFVATAMSHYLGVSKSGTNDDLAWLLVPPSLSGIKATWIVQRRSSAKIRWGRVIAATLSAVAMAFVVLATGVVITAAIAKGAKLNPDLAYFICAIVAWFSAIFTFAALTAKWPLADRTEPVAHASG